MPDGVTFFKAAKWLLACFDSELGGIAYICRYNTQGNSSGTTAVLQVTKRFLGRMESYEGRWGFPLVYKKTDIDRARQLRGCAVDLLAKTESYPNLRSKDRYLPGALPVM